jgi:hypothetical protein
MSAISRQAVHLPKQDPIHRVGRYAQLHWGHEFIPSEDLLAALVTDLWSDQLSRFSAIHGILSMSRQSLLTMTGLVAGQRDNICDIADSVCALRDEAMIRIDELSTAVVDATHKLKTTLENNLRILRATGATEEQLSALVGAVRQG